MELGEAGSAPAAAQPPRSWSFDQDESWEAGSAAAAQPAANTGLGKPAAMDPSTAQAAVGSATGPAATDPRQSDPSWSELSGTGSPSGATAAPARPCSTYHRRTLQARASRHRPPCRTRLG